MTLIITVLTERTIYQSADFRLTNPVTRTVITNTSTKLITLSYPPDWEGFVAYTGIGSVTRGASEFVDTPDLVRQLLGAPSEAKRRPSDLIDTSRFVMHWLEGVYPATPADVAERIRNRGTEWLSKIETALHGPSRHTFILAAFSAGTPQLWVISNFEDCYGRDYGDPKPQLNVSSMRAGVRPRIVVSGWKPKKVMEKVSQERLSRERLIWSHQERRLRERLIHSLADDPARIRRMLAELNAAGANSSEDAKEWISPECSVVSVRADGQGRYDVDGPVDIHAVSMGSRTPSPRELAKLLGIGEARVVGVASRSSKPLMPYEQCRPQTVTPADSGGYILHEVSHPEFVSCQAHDVSDAGVIVGSGNPPGRPADYMMWIATLDGEVRPCGLIAQPGGINDDGEVAAR
jgi:hypothetical protein